jgi:predicted DNA-binding protein
METTTIRVAEETRNRLNALAKRRGTSAGDVVAELVREADDRALLADAVEGWQRLAAEPGRLAAYRAESEQLAGFDEHPPAY